MMSTYPNAEPQVQISPRFGLAYQLGNAAVLHFSYGHFSNAFHVFIISKQFFFNCSK